MKSISRVAELTFLFLSFFALDMEAQEEKNDKRDYSFAAVPIVNYSNTLGASFGLMGQVFYKINTEDTVSPSFSTGIIGIYTNNKTYFGAIFQRLYLKEDRWRIMFAAGPGNVSYQYWQHIPGGGTFIGFNTGATFTMGRVERKVYRELYAGINAVYSKAETVITRSTPYRLSIATALKTTFGMVAFFGLATAIKKISDISNAKILPGGGLGLRYMIIPKERINIGVDIAKGNGDWGLYFRIGESFR